MKRKKIDVGLKTTTITKLLDNAKEPRSYTKLRMISTPRLKRGFHKYLKWCKEKGFLNSRIEGRGKTGYSVIYSLSEKGRTFLEMIA